MEQEHSHKSKTTAAILGMFLGFFGIMDFYAGNIKNGIIKFILSWTVFGIPITIIWNIVNMFGVASESYTDSENKPLAGAPGTAKILAIIALTANLFMLICAIVIITKVVSFFVG